MTLVSVISLILTGQPGPILPTDANPRASGSQGQNPHKTATNAFDNYMPPTGTPPAPQTTPDTPKAISDISTTTLPDDGQTVSAKAVLERIIRKWEKEGVDPACIAGVRRLLSSGQSLMRGTWRPAAEKLTEELERTGEWATLRKQAIDMVCADPEWEKLIDTKVNQDPAVSRDAIKQRIMASLFIWDPHSQSMNAFTLESVVNMNLQKEDPTWEPPKWGLAGLALRPTVYYSAA